eukprot:4392220-Alexandrium_andersonii.AAC.1
MLMLQLGMQPIGAWSWRRRHAGMGPCVRALPCLFHSFTWVVDVTWVTVDGQFIGIVRALAYARVLGTSCELRPHAARRTLLLSRR